MLEDSRILDNVWRIYCITINTITYPYYLRVEPLNYNDENTKLDKILYYMAIIKY